MPRLPHLSNWIRSSTAWRATSTLAGAQALASTPAVGSAAPPTKPPATSPSGRKSGPSVPPHKELSGQQHPMVVLSDIFHRHPSALRLHRELTIALANGDASRASDLAGVLADVVQRVVASHEEPAMTSTVRKSQGWNEMPPVGAEDVEEAVKKTQEALIQRPVDTKTEWEESTTSIPVTSASSAAVLAKDAPPFWRDPAQLCITVLEAAFETEVLAGESQGLLTPEGNEAAVHEAKQVGILEEYLERDGPRWKNQKAAIARIVLSTARSLHLTPEDLQAGEGAFTSSSASVAEPKLNVLRHSNIVVRGEVSSIPSSSVEVIEKSVETELAALEERMMSLGQKLSPREVEMARYELRMGKTRMRYVVGVHRELQLSLDSSAALCDAVAKRPRSDMRQPTGTEYFMEEVIRALNEDAETYAANAVAQGATLSVEDVQARETAARPVLPFTFMLKCCLWFTTTPPDVRSS